MSTQPEHTTAARLGPEHIGRTITYRDQETDYTCTVTQLTRFDNDEGHPYIRLAADHAVSPAMKLTLHPDWAITETCLVDDMPDAVYHSDPAKTGSLSQSGAKTLLEPGGPARYKWNKDHGRTVTASLQAAFDAGHAAHTLVLGEGAPIVRLPGDDLRVKATKMAVEKARANGETPLKPAVYDQVHAMAARLENTPGAVEALTGRREVSAFAPDPETGVWLRGRFDTLNLDTERIGDYKTCVSADPDVFARKAYDLGYDMQSTWYPWLCTLIPDLPDDPDFVFVAQEKTAPYLVSVIRLDDEYRRIGRARCREAIDTYHRCKTTGVWPGYPEETVTVGPPRWLTTPAEAAYDNDPLDPAIEAAFADLLGDVA